MLAQNVLEHIEDDGGAAAEVAASLRPGGRFGVLVPAHPRLYSALDTAYGHIGATPARACAASWRAPTCGCSELHSFNLLGIAGWWAKKVAGSTHLDPRSLSVYEQLVRVWRPVEDRLSPPLGPEPDRDRGEAGLSAGLPELTIIVPVYNERVRVREALDQIAGGGAAPRGLRGAGGG